MKLRFRLFLLPLLALAALAHAKTKAATHATPAPGSYAGAIVIDVATGQTIWEDSADVSNPPASMTKLMTFAVLHDKLADGSLTLQTMVQVDAADARMGGTQVYLDPREQFTVEELIYAMMIQSANDAAHALARTAAGSVEGFVELMNAKARALGMNSTTFRSPHGLPPPSRRVSEGDLSTPRDFAQLCRYLVQNTDVLKYTSVRERAFGAARAKGPVVMINHNKLLGKIAGVDGLKTGYTEAAGYCLSATAERNGRRIVAVIMGSFGPNRSVDKGRARDLKMIELIDRAFAGLPPKPVNLGGAGAPATNAVTSAPTAAADAMPTVKTADLPPAPAARPSSDESSTAKEPAVVFRVIPPVTSPKKP
ncbi:MAG: D-alanyl-D-alanine carboxypeptidase [Candidatus Didemnitutus sp.]|nr:D-alanyl-D-alanine carboxypeptidase [Candidatus Didemnitutus sp.]